MGDRTALKSGQLSDQCRRVRAQIDDLSRNINVSLELARPGESKRIVHVLDTVLPVEKLDSELHTFREWNSRRGFSGREKHSGYETC